MSFARTELLELDVKSPLMVLFLDINISIDGFEILPDCNFELALLIGD